MNLLPMPEIKPEPCGLEARVITESAIKVPAGQIWYLRLMFCAGTVASLVGNFKPLNMHHTFFLLLCKKIPRSVTVKSEIIDTSHLGADLESEMLFARWVKFGECLEMLVNSYYRKVIFIFSKWEVHSLLLKHLCQMLLIWCHEKYVATMCFINILYKVLYMKCINFMYGARFHVFVVS